MSAVAGGREHAPQTSDVTEETVLDRVGDQHAGELERQARQVERRVGGAMSSPPTPPRGRGSATGVQYAEDDAIASAVDAATSEPAELLGAAVIVDDDIGPLAGQVRRSDFLELGVEVACEAADEELAAVGRSTESCPYITAWVQRFRNYTATRLERAVVLFAEPAQHDPVSYLAAIDDQVRCAVRSWVETGRVEMPTGLGALSPDADAETAQLRLDRPGSGGDPVSDVAGGLGAGRVLPTGARLRMERTFGEDFSSVRVHTDGAGARVSRAQRARALTVGEDIAFAPGHFAPDTLSGQALLAHELAHVVQQRGGGVAGRDRLETTAEHEADEAAAAALGGGRARARPRRGLKLQRCSDEAEPMTSEQARQWLATAHLRVVLTQDTTQVLSGMHKSVAIAASQENRDDLVRQDDDQLITHGLGDLRLTSVRLRYEPDTSAPRAQRIGALERYLALHSRTGTFTAHFMGVGRYTLTAHGRVANIPFQAARVVEAAQPDFAAASRQAVPDDLGADRRTAQQERLFWMLQRSEVRRQAAQGGHLSMELHDAWVELNVQVIQRAAEIEAGESRQDTVTPLRESCDAVRERLRTASGYEARIVRIRLSALRAFAGTTASDQLVGTAERLAEAFDRWLLTLLEDDLGEDHELTRTLEHGIETEAKLRELTARSIGAPPKQIPGVFHAESAYLHRGLLPSNPASTGRIVPMPLSLWLVQTGSSAWELRDLTMPTKATRYRTTATSEQDALTDLAYQLRNDEERFPDGMMYLKPPGYQRMDLEVQSDMDFLDWLEVAAVVLAAIGFSVATLGTGTVAAVGGALLMLGSATGGAAALVDTVQAYERGRLTGTRLALNALGVVAAAAGVGQATIATRALATGGRTAVVALGSNARYLLLGRAALGADIATLAVMTGDAAAQLASLSESNVENRGMYAALLLGQLFIQGTFVVVELRSEVGDGLASHPPIRVEDGADGLPVIRPATAESGVTDASTTPRSQAPPDAPPSGPEPTAPHPDGPSPRPATTPPPSPAAPPLDELKLRARDRALRRRVGSDPLHPADMAADAELVRRYRELPVSELVRMRRSRTKWDGYYARRALDEGGGRRGTMAEYLTVRNLDQLREMARHDPEAAQALLERYYRDLTPTQLENLAGRGDQTARQVLDSPRSGPSMDPDAEAELFERIWEQRRTASESATTAADQEAALRGGTVGALDTDIPGVGEIDLRGSPNAPTDIDPSVPRQLQPGTDVALAQHHAEEQLLNRLVQRLEGPPAIDPASLNGKTVRIVVDQQVCSYCGSGLANQQSHAGVLRQFAERYPGVRLEITDLRTGDFMVVTSGSDGVNVQHHRRAGTVGQR